MKVSVKSAPKKFEQKPKVEYAESTTENMTRFKITDLAATFGLQLWQLKHWLRVAGLLHDTHVGKKRRCLPTSKAYRLGYVVDGVNPISGGKDRGSFRFTKSGFDEVHRIVINNQEAF